MKAGIAARMGLAIAGLLMAAAAGAQMPVGGPGFGGHRPPFERALGPQGDRGRWWNNPKMVAMLKLTDDQRKAMDEVLFQHREKLIDLRAGVQKAELEMEPLMKADEPNEAKILAQIDKLAQARAELEKANARFLLALKGKLTPEQWKQVQAIRANRRQERGGWGRNGEGRGGEGRDGQGRGGWGQGGQGPGGMNRRQAPPPPPAQPGAPAAGPQGGVGEGPSPEGPGIPQAGAEQ